MNCGTGMRLWVRPSGKWRQSLQPWAGFAGSLYVLCTIGPKRRQNLSHQLAGGRGTVEAGTQGPEVTTFWNRSFNCFFYFIHQAYNNPNVICQQEKKRWYRVFPSRATWLVSFCNALRDMFSFTSTFHRSIFSWHFLLKTENKRAGVA